MSNTCWVVEIIAYPGPDDAEDAEARVEWRSTPQSSERTAEKIDRGANMNLDHEKFFTRIRTVEVCE